MLSILMTTYNGENYLTNQMESLLNQSFKDFTIYVQDDCSTDRTWEMLREYESKFPRKIRVSRLERNTGNPKHNFYSLMSQVRDDYIMLCDQDDVWLPDKIDKTLAGMAKMEKIYGKDTPLLVHTDLCVVDENLNIISPSFKKAMNANYDRTSLRDQVIQNTLTGCTCMYNCTLAELIGEAEPEYMVMHDWWIMMVAGAFGHIGHLEDQTVLYRQHSANEIGAKDTRTLRYKLKKLMHYKDIHEAISETYEQARSFLIYYRDRLTKEQNAFLCEYCAIPQGTKIKRLLTVFRLGTFKNGLARNIAYILFL